ncbi:Gamma-glutamyl-gamma-aminobutyrate hydrolase PuuD [compost metagenome]
MNKPMIGVLPLYDSGKESYWMLPAYMKAIENEGGIPVMLPLTTDEDIIAALAGKFDGFLFTGGHDINPSQMNADITVSHKQKPPYAEPAHSVHIHTGTLLHHILQTEQIDVNSYHHQGIKALPAGLTAAAAAEDGMVEAVSLQDKRFILAVQWHPEFSYGADSNSRKLFSAFVNACIPTN